MAHFYVRSAAAGAGTGADWTNAFTTLVAALAAAAAADSIWVADDHAETQASAMTMTAAGTLAVPSQIRCVNRAGTVPPVAADLRTTATITTTGVSAMAFAGSARVYGITFNCGTGATNALLTIAATTATSWEFVNCSLRKNGTTSTASAFTVGPTAAAISTRVTFDNTTLHFGHATDGISARAADVLWKNTPSAVGGTAPTTLFSVNANGPTRIRLEGIDLSAVSGTLFGAFTSTKLITVDRCKLHASVTIAAAQSQNTGDVVLIGSSSGTAALRHERHNSQGAQTLETTIILTGGASDGTTPHAWKFVTSAGATQDQPFESFPIAVWNEVTGSAITVTLQGIWGGGAVPDNDDIWAEFYYLGDAASTRRFTATCGKASNLAVATNLAAGAGTWGGSTTKFKLAATFTPELKGDVVMVVKCGAASSTFYVDPKPVVT